MFYIKIKNWWKNCQGVATVEAAMIFPVLLVLLVGTFDLGNGILAGQKTIRASQVTADLITRTTTVDATDIQEAYRAGELALQPFDTTNYGVDIISFSFDDEATAEIVWRETIGMNPINNAVDYVTSLAEPNSGVVMVVSVYEYEPAFAGFVVDNIPMTERAFARGRRSAVVNLEDEDV